MWGNWLQNTADGGWRQRRVTIWCVLSDLSAWSASRSKIEIIGHLDTGLTLVFSTELDVGSSLVWIERIGQSLRSSVVSVVDDSSWLGGSTYFPRAFTNLEFSSILGPKAF